jgi:hypothetical protein
MLPHFLHKCANFNVSADLYQSLVTGELQPNPQLTIISSPPPIIVPTNFRYGNRSSRCTSYTGAEHTGSGRIGGSRPRITATPSDTPKQRISEGYPLQISVITEDGIPWSAAQHSCKNATYVRIRGLAEYVLQPSTTEENQRTYVRASPSSHGYILRSKILITTAVITPREQVD